MLLAEFIWLILPYAVVSLLIWVAWSLMQIRTHKVSVSVIFTEKSALSGSSSQLAVYAVLFVLALLTVGQVDSYPVMLSVSIIGLFLMIKTCFSYRL